MACGGPFLADRLYAEVKTAWPYAGLPRREFDDVLDFVATGGYALGTYERYRRLNRDGEGQYRVASQTHARRYRMNMGTIVEAPTIQVRLKRGRALGEVEEYFVQALVPGDSFIFAGQRLRFEGLRETYAEASRTADGDPKVPAYMGGRLPLSTHLLNLGEVSEQMSGDLAARLLKIAGVAEAVVVAEDGIAYLKVDRKRLDREALRAFSATRG